MQSLKILRDKLRSGDPVDPEHELPASAEIQNNFSNIAEFDLESWLESKISGRSFADVIKEKNQGNSN